MLDLDPAQEAAIQRFKTHGLTIITGGPGTGKSTVIDRLLTSLTKKKIKTLLVAPTGPAAAILKNVTGHDAYTIDMVLETATLLEEYRFARIIADESSMIPITKLDKLMNYIQPRRVCIVGDEHQLSCSEGESSVLETLVVAARDARTGLVITRLTRNFRQTNERSGLVRTLMEMSGERSRIPDATYPCLDEQFKVVTCDNRRDTITKAIQTYTLEMNRRGSIGVQFIAFKRDMVETINKETVNKDRIEISPGVTTGDRVVCTANKYNDNKEFIVANGMIGKTHLGFIRYTNGYKDLACVRTWEGKLVPLIKPKKKTKRRKKKKAKFYNSSDEDDEDDILDGDHDNDDGEYVYNKKREEHLLKNRILIFSTTFSPGRAITVHKSQGNQYNEILIIIISEWYRPPLQLLYTALSRSRGQGVYVFGTRDEIRQAFSAKFATYVDKSCVDSFLP